MLIGNNNNKCWYTLHKYVNTIKLFFNGKIALDPCSNLYSNINAETNFLLPIDSLKENWNFDTIFVNPPYGKDKNSGICIKDWLNKCVITHKTYDSEILALIPVATNTKYWKDYVFGEAKALCFLYDTKTESKGIPMAIVYWGNDYSRFFYTFSEVGTVLNLTKNNKNYID